MYFRAKLFAMNNKISISSFDYNLPDDKIASFPTDKRDRSKLLIYKNKNISEDFFGNILNYLPTNAMLIFNDTKVVKARLNFKKPSGANIEIFCLEPTGSNDFASMFNAINEVKWNCLVGNARRWKEGPIETTVNINGKDFVLTARRQAVYDDHSEILFTWNDNHTFADILEAAGNVPLPPYIHRKTNDTDNVRYQTVYAQHAGSVAAPTAGLHFTPELIKSLQNNGLKTEYVTLHVGLGTFKPVNEQYISDHAMHSEIINVPLAVIKNIAEFCDTNTIIPVGTTSCRTLESLYWIGVMLNDNCEIHNLITLDQWFPYNAKVQDISVKDSLFAIIKYLENNKLANLLASTQLMITPEYKMRICKGIITNFHQPKSTLLLLISSFVGDDWKTIYQYALNHDFRFLSYGDGCLFL